LNIPAGDMPPVSGLNDTEETNTSEEIITPTETTSSETQTSKERLREYLLKKYGTQ
jgi:hypothetical protein